jgi:hypothetical protein
MPAIVRELRAIHEAILATSEEQKAHREAVFGRGVAVLSRASAPNPA